MFGKQVYACSILQEHVDDEEKFVELAKGICKYPEDRIAMCGVLVGFYYLNITHELIKRASLWTL